MNVNTLQNNIFPRWIMQEQRNCCERDYILEKDVAYPVCVEVYHDFDVAELQWMILKKMSDGAQVKEIYNNHEAAERAYHRALLSIHEAKEILYADDKPILYVNDKPMIEYYPGRMKRGNCKSCGGPLEIGKYVCPWCNTPISD